VLRSKIAGLHESNTFAARDKASKHAIQRGFEPELVWQMLKDLLPDKSKV
jgi:regulatory protein